MSKIIMAWSKCKVEFGPTGENDSFATSLTNVGTIKNQTTTLTAEDGDTLQAIATGGEVVAEEVNEGTLQLETTIIEPTNELLTALYIGKTADGEFHVKTHVVAGDYSVKVTPKNAGAVGIKAPVSHISVAPSFGEDTGNELKLTFKISKTTGVPETPAQNDKPAVDNNYWYSRFTTNSALS